MVLHLLFDNSIWSKLLIQHQVITFWMLCRLQYWLFWIQCMSFCQLYFVLQSRSIVLVSAQISMQYLDYRMYKTKNCWRTIDAHFQDGVTKISCTVLAEMAGTTLNMHYWYKATLRLPKMQDQKSLRLRWGSLSGWGRERASVVFATKGS